MPRDKYLLLIFAVFAMAATTIWVGSFVAGLVAPQSAYLLLPVLLVFAALVRWRSR